MKNVTVSELIVALQKFESEGYGNFPVKYYNWRDGRWEDLFEKNLFLDTEDPKDLNFDKVDVLSING